MVEMINNKTTCKLRDYSQSMLISTLKPNFKTGSDESESLLLDLVHNPHAFVISCVCSRQILTERVWRIPLELKKRLGTFKFDELAAFSENVFVTAFNEPTSLHWFNNKMPHLVYTAIQKIKADYQGDVSKLWSCCPSSALVVYRFLQFEGVGQKIATMAANILFRDFKIAVSDTFSLDISLDAHVRLVLKRLYGLPQETSGEQLIYFTRSLYPKYPGVFDLYAWEIGKTYCSLKNPICNECPMNDCCAYYQ